MWKTEKQMQQKNLFRKTGSLFIAILLSISISYAQGHRKVLFISSYSYDWMTVPFQLEGFNSLISNEASVHYLFMDSKKIPLDILIPNFEKQVKAQIRSAGPYDIIVAADDAALQFVLERKDSTFKNIPVVYLGIDSSDLAQEAYKTGMMTGSFESHYDAENIQFALRLIPDAKRICVLTDNTTAGLASRKEFEKAAASFKHPPVTYINSSLLTGKELAEAVSEVKPDAILLYLNLTVDKDGTYYVSGTGAEFVEKHAHVPFFSAICNIRYTTGGALVDYSNIGASAADTVNRILSGVRPSEIKPYTVPPSLKVNYDKLHKFGLSLPEDLARTAITINRPASFISLYYSEILTALGISVIVLLLFIITWYMIEAQNQKELITALKEAKSAQETFLSRMSHDMRTPMNAIIGLSGFGLTEPDRTKSEAYFKQIMNSARYLMGLLNDLLDMNKLESGKTVLYPEPVSSGQIFDDILTIIRPRAIIKNIELVTDFSHHIFSTIIIDKQRIEQVLINVLNNAVKYTPEHGRITWTVTDTADSSGSYAVHVIEDNGVGMSQEFQKNLFKPFAQEHNLLSQSEGGSGLGLAIAKNLITLMGGTITCVSEKGKGSLFTITVPLKHAAEKETSADKTGSSSMPDHILLEGKHALICEDNEINMMIEQKLLEDKGCTTESAENGSAAVGKARTGTYDFILMDVRMPGMDGLEAARIIRGFDKKTPIIALSANAYPEDIRQSLNAGMDAHLIKPIEQNVFFSTIEKLCREGRPHS
jgi:signal transduction histidine kinase/CheY-like chemotaxis protein